MKKVDELPPFLKEEAIKYLGLITSSKPIYINNFCWEDTEQGDNFWRDISFETEGFESAMYMEEKRLSKLSNLLTNNFRIF